MQLSITMQVSLQSLWIITKDAVIYSPLADSWQFYDNSNTNHLSLIASEAKHHSLIIKDEEVWKQLLEISNAKR
jgi:hypothetical protein